ncbi:MAG: hypothetical protein FWE21_05100 [Defluviitaleaceae bacterium]|nr:hypothetical protein [Defluviitaleaceae bacterium]
MLDYVKYFELTNIPIPTDDDAILHYLIEDKLVAERGGFLYDITNLGAISFARRLTSFNGVSRKSLRVIRYEGTNKLKTIREDIGNKGYAAGFKGLLGYIDNMLLKEEISGALRKNVSAYPKIALRELVANAIIHQDFSIGGTGPMVEIFDNRIEITNPGKPLVDFMRIIDNPPRSRNDHLASLMRRLGICEERGSGWDKIAISCEVKQLPAPKIDTYDEHTKVTIYSHLDFGAIDEKGKLWSCYMHAYIKHTHHERMTNTSLRERFGVSKDKQPDIARLIKRTMDKGWIKPFDPNTAPRHFSYVPFWA